MLFLLATTSALALPASGDLQVRVHAPALAFAEDRAEALDPFLSEPDLFEEDVDCWDRVGITDFNLSVPINTVSLEADDGVFRVAVELGDVLGTGWTVYGADTETFDSCPEFEATVDRFAVLDGSLEGALEPVADGDTVRFRWVGSPVVDGTIDTDVAWVPDELVLAFVEATVLDQAALALEETLPSILADALSEPLLDGEYAGFAVTMTLQDAEVVGTGLAFGARTQFEFVGEPACAVPATPASPAGRSPELALEPIGDSHLTLGLTEAFTNQVFAAAWESGAFCHEPETLRKLSDKLASLVDPDVTGLSGLASLDAPPEVRFGAEGARLSLSGQRLTVQGRRNGDVVDVVDARIDLDGRLRFGFAPSLVAITVSLHDIDLSVTEIRLGGGLAELGPSVLKRVQEWMAGALEDELQRLPVFDSLFHTLGLVIRIEDVRSEPGGVALALRLYDGSDAEVDRVPPETSVRKTAVGRTEATLAWAGTDDRSAPLAWAWQLDGQGWSDWTTSTSVTLDGLDSGPHTFAVKARDAWLNEDPTPATLRFQTRSPGEALGCGCASVGFRPILPIPLLPLLVLARRRSRKGARS